MPSTERQTLYNLTYILNKIIKLLGWWLPGLGMEEVTNKRYWLKVTKCQSTK